MSFCHACEKCQGAMHEALDRGEHVLPGREREHLANCEACRMHWEQLLAGERMLQAAASEGEQAPGEGFCRRVMQAVEEEPLPRARRRAAPKLLAVAACAAAVLVAAMVGKMAKAPEEQPMARPVPTPPSQTAGLTLPTLGDFAGVFPELSAPLEVHEDFTWLTRTVVASAQSAADALTPGISRRGEPGNAQTSASVQERS